MGIGWVQGGCDKRDIERVEGGMGCVEREIGWILGG